MGQSGRAHQPRHKTIMGPAVQVIFLLLALVPASLGDARRHHGHHGQNRRHQSSSYNSYPSYGSSSYSNNNDKHGIIRKLVTLKKAAVVGGLVGATLAGK